MSSVGLKGIKQEHSSASDAEDTGTSNTKVSDSGYSCSNSQSQRSTESSNSRNSTSSGSSGYGGHNTNASEDGSTKKKEHKKKKSKSGGTTGSSMGGDTAAAAAAVLAVAVVSPTDNNGCTTSPTAPSVITPSVVVVETAPSSVTVAPAQISETLTETQSGRHPSQVQQENGHSMNVDALHIAALSHTLSSLKKMKTRESADDSDCTPPSQYIADVDPDEIAYLLKYDQTHEVGIRDSQRRKGDAVLKIVVSISDGTVVFTSGLTQVLGYPKDMWLGRSLIDFIQPKHRATFAGSITSAIADFKPSCPPSNKNVFYCCLRKYRGLKTLGFSVIDKRITYLPCQFILSFKEFPSLGETRSLKECLVITAIPVRSAYNHPEDKRISTKFMTRHSATCQLIHVDHEVVSYFGYLPQDMLNRSILDFYHPQDLHFLKKVYEAVVKEPGHPFRSKPCRFRCQNGGYSLVETEMSAFNNPWSMKLEFVIGQHCVLKGPLDPDVVTPCEQDSLQLSDDIIKDTKMIQKEIIGLLNETLVKTPETAKQQVSKRCKDLAVFMEHLMDEIIKPPDLKVVVPTEEQSFSERDSVMLGTISPHHDYYDSKSSSETPPSYNQLNYNENILRFFESQPKTNMCEDSGESKNGSGGEEGKISPVDISSSMSKSGGSGVSSGQSTESTGNSGETTSNNNVSNVTLSYKPHALTEHLLSRHNEDMEKQMVQKHREQRCKSERDSKTKDRLKPYDKSVDITPETHGIKRSGSHSWEGDVNYKSIKASHANASGTANAINGFMKGAGLLSTTICGINAAITTTANAAAASTAAAAVKTEAQGCGGGLLSPPQTTPVAPSPLDASKAPPNAQPNPSLWPPFSVSLTPVQSSAQEYSAPAIASSLMPMYYLTDNPRLSTDTTNASAAFRANRNPTGLTAPYLQQQVQYMPSMLYHPVVFGPTSMMYSPLTAVYPSGFQHASGAESRPTVQQAPVQLRERTMAADKKPSEVEGDSNGTSVGFDDSSYHSSFYSFLKTDKSDESMRSSSENGKPEDPAWRSQGSRPVLKPVRKEAPWVEALKVTPHLMFKYQMKERSSEQVLKEDMDALKQIIQPSLVNDQLSQMYHDLELGGLSKQQSLEEGVTSSSESSGEESMPGNCSQEASGSMKQRRFMEYDKMTILFEEDAPMPPPLPTACT